MTVRALLMDHLGPSTVDVGIVVVESVSQWGDLETVEAQEPEVCNSIDGIQTTVCTRGILR